ncbi:hypothetical protein DK427_02710 [Methylobacterium radiodurans]|uniref:Uncharacterized protein n=2 Tax=Methylobacterium radiodurans TaxID=2202828 RepID=A0A2U8VZY6_9HYPH|nr:hypothetical protein DK427_02710 [Methylobacterium radiodurans]
MPPGRTGGLVQAILAGLSPRRPPVPEPEPAHWPEAPREGPGYETEDVDVRRTGLVMAGLAASALVAVALMLWLMHAFTAGQRRALPPLTPQQTAVLKPPPPNLQADPYADIARERAAERGRLDGYALTEAGRARIPIGRAMELVTGRPLDPAR